MNDILIGAGGYAATMGALVGIFSGHAWSFALLLVGCLLLLVGSRLARRKWYWMRTREANG